MTGILEKFATEAWHIPHMVFELLSFAQNKLPEEKRQYTHETGSDMNPFFHESTEGAMDLFWDAFATEEDYLKALDIMQDQKLL